MKSAEAKAACLVLTVLALVLAWAPASCGTQEAKKRVRLGAVYPLSGAMASAGESASNGIGLALEIVNNRHDLNLPLAQSEGIASLGGAPLEAVFANSRGIPSEGRFIAEKLIRDSEELVALIGCYQSAVTAEAALAAEQYGVPFITATSTAPSLTQKGLGWFFRTTPDEEVFVRNFFQFLEYVGQEQGDEPERLGIVYEDSVWGSEVASYAERYAGTYGYSPVEKVTYSSDASNVDEEVGRLKALGVDVVIQASYTADAILCIQTYRKMDYYPSMVLADDAGFNDPAFLRAVGGDADYLFVRQVWSTDLTGKNPAARAVNEMYRERYGANMDDTSARTLTAVLVLADAIDRAGSTSREKVRDALLETDLAAGELIMPWDGVSFDRQTHQNMLARGIISQIIDSSYYTVWPPELATRDMVWPAPARG
jgi:branched-chain amino acid transport system substrate-binding protein